MLYDNWVNNVIRDMESITSPEDRIDFLYKKLDYFDAIGNIGDDADVVRNRLERLIKRESESRETRQSKKIRSVRTQINAKIPETLDDLFPNPDIAQSCIDVLKKAEPPLLSKNEQFIGKPKGALCVWIDVLERRGLIQRQSNRGIYAQLISERLSRSTSFYIDESMFGRYQTRAEEKYRKEFEILLSQVSQKSQAGK